jgi:hypothetical protein
MRQRVTRKQRRKARNRYTLLPLSSVPFSLHYHDFSP